MCPQSVKYPPAVFLQSSELKANSASNLRAQVCSEKSPPHRLRVGAEETPNASPPKMSSASARLDLLHLLNKLTDNHTRQKAWEELSSAAERIDGHTLPTFLGCLHTTNAQHTLACRRGAIRLYGVLATFHPQLMLPHLSRVADSIVARIKDKVFFAACCHLALLMALPSSP